MRKPRLAGASGKEPVLSAVPHLLDTPTRRRSVRSLDSMVSSIQSVESRAEIARLVQTAIVPDRGHSIPDWVPALPPPARKELNPRPSSAAPQAGVHFRVAPRHAAALRLAGRPGLARHAFFQLSPNRLGLERRYPHCCRRYRPAWGYVILGVDGMCPTSYHLSGCRDSHTRRHPTWCAG